MPSTYVTQAQATAYGVTNPTVGQIAIASALIDAYLRRPEGITWAPDSLGQPCYMAGANGDFSFTLNTGISPGSTVPVSLSGPTTMLQVGDILILDAATPSLCEACTVAMTVGPNGAVTIALQNVINAHAMGAIAQHGLVIEEQKYMPKNRPLTLLSRTPLVRMLSGVGRYAYGRRGDGDNDYNMEYFNLLAAITTFGGPPYWELFQAATSQNWDPATGQLWVPAGVMQAYYTEVKVRYVAGYPVNGVPAAVQNACAQLILAAQSNPLLGSIKSYKAGDTQVTNFAATIMSDDVKMMLAPYAVRINL